MSNLIRIDGPTDGIATITLDRPDKKNALSIALRDEVTAAVETFGHDPAAKVIVITGAGSAFSGGFDMPEFALLGDEAGRATLWGSSDRFHHAILDCRLPTIAAVNGPARAGGFDLAVLCDLRIAATTASFSHPEQTFGDVVYGPLHELVGGAVARELCLTGRPVDAAEALALHLVSAVVAPEELAQETARWAAMIARAPRHLLLRTREKIRRRAGVHPSHTLDL